MAPGQGVLAGKKFTFLISEGGTYSVESGHGGRDYLTGYLVMVAQALGATDVELIFSEFGLAGIQPGMEDLVEAKAKSIEETRVKVAARAAQ